MTVDYDKTFEFDYLMQVDQESRENAAREDSSSWSSSYHGRSFYTSWNKTKNTISKADKWRIIIMFIIAVFIGLYYINEAHEKKSREETLSRIREMEAQGLLGTWINTWYEEVQELNSYYITGYIDESVKEKYKVSPYEWCSYVWADWKQHKCDDSLVDDSDYDPDDPINFNPERIDYTPTAVIPEAHIPTATIPTSVTPKKTHGNYEPEYDEYYNENRYDYYDWYNWYDEQYENRLDTYWEEYEARWFDSYDDYYRDYFDRNKADNFEDYYEVYSDYSDYWWNYTFDDFRDDFYDDHYWEYFDDDGR